MSIIKITAPKFAAEDGKEFDTRKEAEAYQAVAVRTHKLVVLFDTIDSNGALSDVGVAQIAGFVATHADAIIAALSNPLGKGRRVKTPTPALDANDPDAPIV